MAFGSLGSPLLATSAAEESPSPKGAHITYLSKVKEEGDDVSAQVAMVTEEDGAPQVALITQDGAQQVQTPRNTPLRGLWGALKPGLPHLP